MKTAIITIGDEILIGQIVDTNTAWMAQKLTNAGFDVTEKISIGDNARQIKDTIADVFTRVDVILTTGGIGPTKDDITKKTLCEYYGTELIFDDSVLANIQNVVSTWTALNPLTHDQAYVPKDCTVIQNKVGTAPITWFDRNDKVLVSMPGVPYEMKFNMENEIIPRLQSKYRAEAYVSKVFIVVGYTESALAIHLTDWENNLPEGFGLAYLPSPGVMKLRLFVKGEERRHELEEEIVKLYNLLDKAIVADRDIPLEKILGEHLLSSGLTIGTAESCTGGLLSKRLTDVSGASEVFHMGVVTYANQAKEDLLSVSHETLEQYGAVSPQTAREMAEGIVRRSGSSLGVGITGIAGPDGGTAEKPVGLIYIALSDGEHTWVTKRNPIGRTKSREWHRHCAASQALDMVRRYLEGLPVEADY